MRFGRILEDLDSFAGLISYTHLQDPNAKGIQKSHMAIVTAAVDRIDLYNTTLSPYLDVKLCGHVTWVGRSSMEITMNVEQVVNGIQEKMLTARFVMVARNPYTKGPGVVNPIQPEGQREIWTFNIRVKPENTVWMRDTQLKTISICHPEERNLWSKIFGGFLMRKAFELAFADASLYCKNRPTLTVVDDIIFLQPVEIGSLLFFSSEIVYTEGSLMQVRVHAEVLDILTGSRNTTNYFYFVFDSNNPNMPQVIPRTYAGVTNTSLSAPWAKSTKSQKQLRVQSMA
ncbi:hypothetical protein C0Q70_20890 [Pomacea canaliculata]|uniref:HotDog ACOT-type domain-containing protein n=1 Tax=Pomacea canaliculata TaxID=400727 RepID=A0A2T7NB09_POMCA|nr:hypothetical protein C0Q70_20890 [Pomacea canaliculata]